MAGPGGGATGGGGGNKGGNNPPGPAPIDVSSQLKSILQLQRAMAEAAKAAEGLANASQGVGQNVKAAGEAVAGTANQAGAATEQTEKLAEAMKKVSISKAAWDGLKTGFSNLIGLTKSAVSVFTSLAGIAARATMFLLALPLAPIKAMISLAASAPATTEYAQALEKVRKVFGDLAGPTSSAIVRSAREMEGFGKTGLGTFQVFGNAAERLEYVTAMAEGMGEAFNYLEKQFKNNEGAAFGFAKGLGLDAEEMRTVADISRTTGESMEAMFINVTKQAYGLGTAFGFQGKVISRDVVKAMKDMGHFAQTSAKQLAEAVTYSRGLGLELEKITGIMDAFETFDTASENVAKLSQAFGVNVDTVKMMSFSTPSQQVDYLRQAFAAAGKSAETFDRHQLKVLAGATNLSPEIARQAFSLKNQGVEMDKITKKGDDLQRAQITQAEALKSLAPSIERMVKAMESQSTSFFGEFVKGIGVGIQQTGVFRDTIFTIKKALFTAFQEGVKLGRALVDILPGFRNMLEGMSEMFKPGRVSGFFSIIRLAIEDFAKGTVTFQGAMDRVKNGLSAAFSTGSAGGAKYLEGFKSFFKFLVKAASEGMVYFANQISEGLRGATEILSGKKKVPGAAEAGGFVMNDVVRPLIEALKKSVVILAPAIWGFVSDTFGLLKSYIKDNWPEIKAWGIKKFSEIKEFFRDPEVQRAILEGIIALKSSVWEGISFLFQSIINNPDLAAPALIVLLAPVASNIGSALFKNPEFFKLATSFSGTLFNLAKGGASSFASGFATAAPTISNALGSTVATFSKFLTASAPFLAAAAAVAAAGYALYKSIKYLRDVTGGFKSEETLNREAKEAAALRALHEDQLASRSAQPTSTPITPKPEEIKETSSFIAPVSLEDATKKLADLEGLSKRVNAAGFDIKKVVADIKGKFDGVEFNFFKEPQLKQLEDSSRGMSSVASMVEGIKKTVDVASGLTTSKLNLGLGKEFLTAYENFLHQMHGLKDLIERKIGSATYGFDKATPMIESVSKMLVAVNSASENAKKLTSVTPFTGLDVTMKNMNDRISAAVAVVGEDKENSFGTRLQKFADGLNAVAVGTAADTLTQTFEKINALNKTLASGDLNVTKSLEMLPTKMGLGNQVKAKIMSGDVVVNINLDVNMKAGELENVLLLRKDSKIRDRLNYATENLGDASKATKVDQRIPKTTSDQVKPLSPDFNK